MRFTTEQPTLKRGPGRSLVTALVCRGALIAMLGLALAPSSADAQQGSTQLPSWQQRPVVQSTSYVTPAGTVAAPMQSVQQRTRYRGTSPYARVAQSPQMVMSEPAQAEGAPEEIYPSATPEAGDYGDGQLQPAPMEEGPYYEGYGQSCGESCGMYGGSCMGDGGCWTAGEFYDGGGCCPWLGMEPGRLWVRGEYLLWWTKGMDLPPLLSLSTTSGGTSQSVIGDETIGDRARSGWRITFGLRPTECTPWGAEVTYFQLGPKSFGSYVEGDGESTILTRPFYNLSTGEADVHEIANMSGLAGSLSLGVETKFNGVEVLFRRRVMDWCVASVDFLAGWRYNQLSDELDIYENIPEIVGTYVDIDGTTLEAGSSLRRLDQFRTRNIFNGGELGFTTEMQHCRWSIEAMMKIAFGSTQSRVSVAGSTRRTPVESTSSQTLSSGMLALPSNEGVYTQSSFTMIPELGLTVGYDLTCRLRATFGYSVIYWGQVVRAGDQINLDINPTQLSTLTGLARPNPPFSTTDFWAQGMNFGLEYHF